MKAYTIKAQHLMDLINLYSCVYSIMMFENDLQVQKYHIKELDDLKARLTYNGVDMGAINRVISQAKKQGLKPYNGYLYDFITLECNIEVIH